MDVKQLGNKTKNSGKITAPLLCTVLALSACGGSSGGEPASESFGTISGTAAKGIVRNALVTALELDSSGKELRTLGTATTDEKGNYELPVNKDYAGGPILFKLSALSDGSTRMVCDISDGCKNNVKFGETLSLGEDFKIESILPNVEKGTKAKAHITPFTHMAAKRVLAGSVSPDAIKKAFSEVSQVVGIDVLKTAPMDITKISEGSESSEEQRVYGAFLAAAGKLAVDDPEGLEAGLKKLANTFEDGQFNADDSFSITSFMDAVNTQAEHAKIKSPKLDGIIANIKAQTDKDGNFDPEPSSTATAPPVDKAKALVKDIRTWVSSVNDLSDPAKAFDADVEKIAKVMNSNSTVLAEMTANVTTSIFEKFQSNAKEGTLHLGEHTISVSNRQGASVGTVGVTLSNESGIKIVIPEQTLEGIMFNLELATNLPKEALDKSSFNLEKAKISATGKVSNSEASMELDAVNFMVEFESPLTITPDADKPPLPKIKHASLSGKTILKAEGATFDGNASMKFAKLTQPVQSAMEGNSSVSLEKVSIDGEFLLDDGNSFSANATLTVNNAATFDTFAFLRHQPVMWINGHNNTDPLNAKSKFTSLYPDQPQSSSFSAYFGHSQTCYYGPSNYECRGEDFLDATEYVSDIVKQQYPSAIELKNINVGVNLVDGGVLDTSYSAQVVFPDFETAEKFAQATLIVTLDLALKGYPNSKAVIVADRNKIKGGDFSMTLILDGRVTTYSALVDADSPIPETMKVTNLDNVTLELTRNVNQLGGKISVDGAEVGTIENTDSGLFMVRYKDGSFETLQ
jgi:hypothetical protein